MPTPNPTQSNPPLTTTHANDFNEEDDSTIVVRRRALSHNHWYQSRTPTKVSTTTAIAIWSLSLSLSRSRTELRVTLNGNTQYAAVQSTSNGAPFCAITVCDTIGELPEEMERPAKKRC
ncbi:hypothetical protein RHGRI_022075 [Rhododendron griersonianum]|uniref:Uncharacterized protein n=1 Tax=Rhododendron griersonianum TaxID=479676 RepID=A0AAV6JRP7_9ERIC|nr:hypothetical protein RHGRI_022075 [Rhododendron griersonianum]